MMKRLLLAFALLFVAAPALAAEHVGALSSITLETGWTLNSGGASLAASNVWAKRAFKTDATILKGHTYQYSVTISGYSGTGSLEAYALGVKMSCSGSWVNSPNGIYGENTVADNFTTNNAITSSVSDFPSTGGVDQRESDPNGSFRFNINTGKSTFLPDDPMVCPGEPGVSHLHMFWGNTGINAYSTYHSLRTTGGSSCSPDAAPVCRSGYWQPAMLDGAGHALTPISELTYYKAIPMGIPECNAPLNGSGVPVPDSTHIGKCVEYPNGLRFIAGCDMANMPLHCPINYAASGDTEAGLFTYACHGHGMRQTADTNDGIIYHSIDAARTSGNPNCTVGATNYLYVSLQAPICWDGLHLDSPNHRDHVAYQVTSISETSNLTDTANPYGLTDTRISMPGMGIAQCPADHPYVIPSLSLQEGYKIDANFVAGHWHLSCDEQMGSSWPAGACLHMDYWEAWSQPIKDRWTGNASTFTGCDNGRNNGNFGMLCDGYKIIGGNGGGATDTNSMVMAIPRGRIGWSRQMTGNGTFTGEIKAPSNGELGLYGVGGFTATGVTFTLTDVTNTGKQTGVSVHAN